MSVIPRIRGARGEGTKVFMGDFWSGYCGVFVGIAVGNIGILSNRCLCI